MREEDEKEEEGMREVCICVYLLLLPKARLRLA